MRSATALASALVLVLLPIASAGTCYGYDGSSWENNFVCPGSQACCGNQGMCLPNKLCNSKKDGTGEVIRGPCAVKPYDTVECAEICLYDEISKKFPRVTICEDDGKYCCDNDKRCCDEGRGVVLNGVGKVVSSKITITRSMEPSQITSTDAPPSTITDPSPTTPSSGSTSLGTTTSAPAVPSIPAVPEPASPSVPTPAVPTGASGGLATGAKIGIGIAVPVAVLGAAALGAFLWFRRRRGQVYSASGGEYSPPPKPQELAAEESPQELQGYAKEQSNLPIELPAEEVGGGVKTEYKPYARG